MEQARPAAHGSVSEMRGWLLAAAGVGCFFVGVGVTRARASHAPPPVAPPAVAAPMPEASSDVSLSLVYSPEIAGWITPALAAFTRAHPEIPVRPQAMGSLDAERAIATGRLRPTLWIPADTSAADMLDAAQSGVTVVRDAARWPRSLVLTPMVFAVWSSRAAALAPTGNTLSWTRLATVARAPHGWSDVGGDHAWGSLKFGHTDPTRSHAGLEALTLMAYGYRDRATALTPADVTGPGFEGFVRALEASDPAGDRGTSNSGEFAQTFALQGPGRYDLVMMYESQAIASMEVARGRWGESLRVYYPPVNVWSDHPLCLLDDGRMGDATRAAAELLADHLRSVDVQTAAVSAGFRPASVEVPVATDDAQNPFVRYRAQGVTVALPQVADAPSLATLDAITSTWRRATGR